MITQEKVEQYLELLTDTDEPLGQLWGRVKATEHLVKQYKAQAFLSCTGTVAEREAKSITDPQVARAQNEYENAEAEYKTVWAQRVTAQTWIDVWRSQNASQRKGNI